VADKIDSYYVCVYLRDGKPIGHGGNWKSDFPADLRDEEKQPLGQKNKGMADVAAAR
jgi:hypothetical protein